MELLNLQIPVILFLQTLFEGTGVTVFKAITFLGDEQFFLFFLPVIFWTVDFKLAVRSTALLLICALVSSMLKLLGQQPRPFTVDPHVVDYLHAYGYGLPSGHSSPAVVMWGAFAAAIGKRWAWITMLLIVSAIALSRLVVGAHFITDVLAGLLLGAIFLWFFVAHFDRIASILQNFSRKTHCIFAISLPLVCSLLVPEKFTVIVCASLSSLWLSSLLPENEFDSPLTFIRAIFRYFIGMSIAVFIYWGLKSVFPASGEANYLAFAYVRYFLVTLWVVAGFRQCTRLFESLRSRQWTNQHGS